MQRNNSQNTAVKIEDDPNNIFQDIIIILEKNFKYLVSVNLDPTTAIAYKKIVRYLKHLNQEEIEEILGVRRKRTRSARKQKDPQMSDHEILRLSGNEISEVLSTKPVTRKFLERLAVIRFGISAGALSALRNRDAVVEKLRIMVDHENTHDAISRVLKTNNDDQLAPHIKRE